MGLRGGSVKSKRAFTLVELVVTMAVMAIALACVGSIFVMGVNMVNNHRRQTNEHALALLLEAQIKNQVQYAGHLKIYADASGVATAPEANLLYFGTYQPPAAYTAASQTNTPDQTKTGLASVTGGNAVPSFYMQGNFAAEKTWASFSGAGSSALTVTVTVGDYSIKQTIVLLNMSTGAPGCDAAVTGQTAGSMIGFNIYTPS